MPYNLTAIMDNSTTVIGFVQGTNNELMGGLLGVLILLVITVITFIGFIQATNDSGKSIMASSFIAFGLAILLRALSLIPNLALYITLAAAGIAIAFTWKR